MRFVWCVLLSGLAAKGLAQNTTVPHEFRAGTPALAAEVNENFATLVQAINATGMALENLRTSQELGTVSISAAPYNGEQLPVFYFQWDGTSADTVDGSGGSAGKASFGAITVGKLAGPFSPNLFRDFATGVFHPTVRIDLVSPNSVSTSYVLEAVRVLGFGSTTVGTGTLLETVAFGYDKVTISTTTGETTTSVCFDVGTNVLC